jgi:GTP-binding protein Era
MSDETVKQSGFVAIVGRPNVGKSTLLNTLIGEKISITTPKPQTTRWQILGIKTLQQAQIIYIDTPGVHQGQKRAMNRYMNRIATAVIQDADMVVFVVDATSWRAEDELVLNQLETVDKPVILVINKVDLVSDKGSLLPLIDRIKQKRVFTHIIPLSAKNGDQVSVLEQEIVTLLPEGPMLYPEDQVTDKQIHFQLAEIVREQLILMTQEELPYATTVAIEQYKIEDKLTTVHAVIWVEREGQKGIIIGKKGAHLKKIGSEARRAMEKRLGQKVFLQLWVKVKEDWTDDEKALHRFGYDQP